MKRIKSVLSLILALVLTLSTSNIAFASSSSELVVRFVENGQTYDAKVITDNGTSTVYLNNDIITFNSKSNVLTINNISYIISNGESNNSLSSLSSTNAIQAKASGISNSYDGYSYDYYPKLYNSKYYTFWSISIPDNVKLTYQTNLNSTNLQNFKSSVDSIVSNHDDLVANGYGSAITIVLAAIGTAAAGVVAGIVIAILSSLGFASPIDAVSSFTALRDAQKDAKTYFNAVISVSIP